MKQQLLVKCDEMLSLGGRGPKTPKELRGVPNIETF